MIGLPIGNPKDLTFRAAEILKTVDIVACEDTREFKHLLNELKLDISAKIYAYHEHNEAESAKELVKRLLEGTSIAVVSDAGTPGMSDPGHNLLKLAYAENSKGSVSPGPSSVTGSLSVSPTGGNTFLFLGFLPQQNAMDY